MVMHSEQLSRPEHGDRQHGADGVDRAWRRTCTRDRPEHRGCGRCAARGRSARRGALASGRDGVPLDEVPELGGDVVSGHHSQELTIEAQDERPLGLAQPDRVLGQRLEDRLEVEGGPADHLEQLAGRRLLLEGHPQLAVARLQLGEQADVLDGDDGLVGEGLQELDVAVGEGAGFGARDDDRANGLAIAQHRHREHASPAAGLARPSVAIHRVGERCPRSATARRSRIARPETWSGCGRPRIHPLQELEHFGRVVVVRDEVHSSPSKRYTAPSRGAAQAARRWRRSCRRRAGRRSASWLITRRISRGRRLLLQGLGEVGVLGLQLGEQARVLDGDGGLVGEGLHQRDLAVGERAGPRGGR